MKAAPKDYELNIRHATIEDLPEIVRLAIELAGQHINYDSDRFNLASFEPIQKTYVDYFSKQLKNSQTIILIAELNQTIVGYAFIRSEPKDFLELLGESVWLHDIYFSETARGNGVGKKFFEAIINEARHLGSKNLMLSVSPHNKTAQKFFTQLGFRPTLQEMRLDFISERKSK